MTAQSIYNNLRPKRASALLGLRALAGSDMSGRFAGWTKDSCFKACMSCDDEIMDALSMIGNDTDLLADVSFQLERFRLYFVSIQNPPKSEWALLIDLLKSKS